MGLILVSTGLTFGSTYYYYSDNQLEAGEEEKLLVFDKEHIEDLNNSDNMNDILPAIFVGLKPFFSFPETTNLDIDNSYTLIPFIEHVIGWFTSTTIIGILASHFVVKKRKDTLL
ncbi:hypothetical protein [Mechercharimyces sp. CAU 1602]|uniref:hypothetical protein n=1 Tax=Mechercharimyces sp. CAU 1602 TaxID=2973933 RepID=UPI0021619935|nr:hypothetical protein [Mechercharimyces sp. CAU 1602]